MGENPARKWSTDKANPLLDITSFAAGILSVQGLGSQSAIKVAAEFEAKVKAICFRFELNETEFLQKFSERLPKSSLSPLQLLESWEAKLAEGENWDDV